MYRLIKAVKETMLLSINIIHSLDGGGLRPVITRRH